jgi:hypothetical protein
MREEGSVRRIPDHEEDLCPCAICRANRAWQQATAKVNHLRRNDLPAGAGRCTHPPIRNLKDWETVEALILQTRSRGS